MDAKRFDTLTRSLTEAGTRRGLLSSLTALPVLGGLIALIADGEESDAKGRRKRRKKPHHHRKKSGNRSGNKKQRRCEPESKAKTCSGTCGAVLNNCEKTVDCGSCACDPPCGDCFICQSGPNTPGECVPDPEQQGEACGSAGQVCQADGGCACQAGSCPDATPICADGQCVSCSEEHPCPNGCCAANGACQGGGQNDACGFPGGPCANCAARGEVCSDRACRCDSGVTCAAGVCCPSASDVCDADNQCCSPTNPCAGACGTLTDTCGQSVDCGPCPPRILRFRASPDNINRAYSETAELFWLTTTATDCSIDNGVGSVPCYGSVSVGPNEATTYTLSASGPGGGPVTAQATVTVQYCHAVNPSGSGCPGSYAYCQSGPIPATSSEHAKAACETCYGAGNCRGGDPRGYWYWSESPGAGAMTFYIYRAADEPSFWCDGYVWQPGDIIDQTECPRGQWA